ncbi:MAG: hypothetical protein R3192_13405 [Woeseiaceae bacterium]|nr:hypothetical protein [Woeseiaceae bacterium]
MNRKLLIVIAALTVMLCAGMSRAEQLIVEFKGTGNRTTAEFKAQGPWILDWRISSDYAHQISFDLDLLDARTGVLKGSILRTKRIGNGVRLFNESGSFRFRINGSFINWHLKVKQLTPAEAEAYEPRSPR